jgi:hypothetical protein
MADFQRTQIARYPLTARQTLDKSESRYWRSFKVRIRVFCFCRSCSL